MMAAQSSVHVAPEVLDAENALLGVLLSEPDLTADVARTLSPDDFYGAEWNQSPNAHLLARLMRDAELGVRSEPHALSIQLSEELAELGGGRYIGDLIAHAPPAASLPELVRQIATSAAQRRLSRVLARPGLTPDELAAVLQAETRKADDLVVRVKPIRATPFRWRDPQAIPRREWLYDLHLIRRFVSATFAPGAVGKTMLLIVEALAMATGRPLLGAKPRQPLTVWLVNLEDPLEELERRVAAACLHYGIAAEDLGGRLFIDSGREANVIIARSTRGGVEVCAPCVRQLEREITARKVDVLIVDPFVACHEVEENSNGAINIVVKQWAALADRTGCAIELVHHVRKAGAGQVETTVEDGRGAGALLAGVRSARVLNSMTPDQASEWGIEERRLFFRVDNGKANLAPPASAAKWRQLQDVDLENGPAGFSDRVGVPAEWQPPCALDGVSVADLCAVQQKIAAGDYKANAQSPEWAGVAVAEVLALNLGKSQDKAKVSRLLKTWLSSGALRTERRTDPKRREDKAYIAVGEWVTQ